MNQKWQTLKIFLSSTFLDMHTERDHLLHVVFPELKARCRQKRINLIEIDLRWGVTQKEADDGNILDICMDEVDACRPFFVGLLGHRYGWVSEGDTHSITAKEIYHGVLHHFVPRQIMARDFKKIIEVQSLSEAQKQALANGYQWLGEKGKYGLKDDCPDQAIIQSIFKPFSSYKPDQSFFFFRQEALTRQLMGDKQDDYLGSIDNRTKLADLKAEIKAAGLPVFEYDEIEAFGQQLLETLWERLQQEAENVPPTDWLAEEAEFHELFMADRTQRFVGRQAMLDEMQRFCQRADEPNIFVITGEPGSGKSTLMARFVEKFSEQQPSQLMIAHFIGASPTSTNLRLSLRRICALLDKAIGAEENLPDDINELIQGFSERLEKTERQVVIVLDAVNQFEMRDNPHAMHWLPQKMPNNIRVVISTLPSDAYDALLRRGVKPAVSLIPLGGALIRTLSGHTDYVQAVAVTPDGSRVVSGSADNTLKVWDLDSGQLLHTLNEHSARVWAVTITPDGEKIISSSSDNTLKIWDLASGQLLHTLIGHSHWVKVVTVTPDGERVVSGSRDGTLKVWDLANGQLLHTLRGHSDYVWAATVTPDGERVVSCSWDNTLKVWHLASGQLLHTLRAYSRNFVNAVTITPDGERVVSGGGFGTLNIWDLASGQLLHTLRGHSTPSDLWAITVTPDGSRVVSGSSDHTLKIWDLASGQLLHTCEHSRRIAAVKVTPDGLRMVSGSKDKTLKVWELACGKELHTWSGHSDEVTAVTITPDGSRVVSGSLDKTLKVWDLARKELGAALLKSCPLDVHEAPIIIVNQMLYRAIKECASDLHFEPYEKFYRVRFRIDGVLRVIATPPVKLAGKIAARIKFMSRLDVSECRVPQDGRIKFKLSKDEAIDFSVSTCPTFWGEKVVIKIINDSSVILNLDALGFEEEQKRLYLEALTNSSGMILISGPHDIGKTVTFYTGINLLNKENVNIYTIHHNGEEINIPGINKIELQDYSDYPIFLRTFLRQIPDIILLEEMGSLEIASLAFIASNRCLVMSSLFSNDAPQTLTRLMDMGIPPFEIAEVKLIISQRLVRCLCEYCKIEQNIPDEHLLNEGFKKSEIPKLKLYTHKPNGCEKCDRSGYNGRIGIFQVMPISEEMKRLIMKGCNSITLARQARSEGIPDLRESGLKKVKNGLTSLVELNQVVSKER